ncbi:MAG: DUF4369 domain-containing protein [Clostridium sp.]|nr:DUF4369 domain-containing protein [Clostridium sp.]
MKRIVFYILCLSVLFACGGTEGKFRLQGRFDHLQQGEFYIYSPDGVLPRIDTIRVERGSFDYTTDLSGEAVFYLLYPNFSEHVIFARGGDVVTVKGDANNLKETRIEGNEENEMLTEFRLANNGKAEAEVRGAAGDFIARHPASSVSTYLFKRHFLEQAKADRKALARYYELLCQAQPDNIRLTLWRPEVTGSKPLEVGDKLPDFELPMQDGDTIRPADYRGKYLLITFWAGWDAASSSLVFTTGYQLKHCGGRLAAITYSLDTDSATRAMVERRDTVSWPSYCDYRVWNSPLVQTLRVEDVPYMILSDTTRTIVACGTNYDKDIMPVLKTLHSDKERN